MSCFPFKRADCVVKQMVFFERGLGKTFFPKKVFPQEEKSFPQTPFKKNKIIINELTVGLFYAFRFLTISAQAPIISAPI